MKTYQRPTETAITCRGEGEDRRVRGYAAVFDEETELIPGILSEVIRPGAFDGAGLKRHVLALFDHDTSKVLGNTASGTLKLSQDERGLAFEADPPGAAWAQDLLASMERGDIRSASFGFVPTDVAYVERSKGPDLREVRALDLYEISVHAMGQYDGAVSEYRGRFEQDLTELARVVEEEERQAKASASRARDMLRLRTDLLKL